MSPHREKLVEKGGSPKHRWGPKHSEKTPPLGGILGNPQNLSKTLGEFFKNPEISPELTPAK